MSLALIPNAFANSAIPELVVKADGRTDVVVPFTKSTAAKVRLAEAELNSREIEILNSKREEVFHEVINKYLLRFGFSAHPETNQTARGLGLVIRLLQRLDYEMLAHAKQMTTCTQWGVCSSIMVQSGIGFLRAFAAVGINISWDSITKFGQNEWEKSKYVDVEFGKYAYTPAIILIGGYKFVVHFDMVKDEPVEKFETHYRLASLIQTDGPDTFGSGTRFVLGLPSFPFSLGMKYKTYAFRHRYDNAIERTCEFLLAQKARFLGYGEDPDRSAYSIRRADLVPDDVQ